MSDMLAWEPQVRAGSFALVYLLMLTVELLWPRRPTSEAAVPHNLRNLAVVVIDTLVVRLLVPILPVGVALWAQAADLGLLNQVGVPALLHVVLTIVVFDLAIYGQHVLFHRVPLLWRLHRVHHSDLNLDASSGLRFHPVEILLSLLIKSGLVVLLGADPVGVMLFEVILNAMALFNHANVLIPPALDRWLRLFVVTPDMHRIHHSVRRSEHNSNFGFNLALWDRLFATYTDAPEGGQGGMRIGVEAWRDLEDLRLPRLLLQPLDGRPDTQPPPD